MRALPRSICVLSTGEKVNKISRVLARRSPWPPGYNSFGAGSCAQTEKSNNRSVLSGAKDMRRRDIVVSPILAAVKTWGRPPRRAFGRWLHNIAIRFRTMTRFLGLEFLYYEIYNRSCEPRTRNYRRRVEPDVVLSRTRTKNLVFTVTAGRTGTLFLQKLLSLLPDTTSLHEPEPAFHRYLRHVQRDPAFAREFLLNYKLPAICDYPSRSYCEMSHVFCKGFLQPLLDLEIQPNLIVLRRHPRSIARSLLERYTIPERTYYGIGFLLSPRDPGVLPLEGWRRMTDYQLLFWYALEIERRQRDYATLARQSGSTVYEVTTDELNDSGCFRQLVETLGLLDPSSDRSELARRHAAVAGIAVNRNRFPMRFAADLDGQEEVVWNAVSAADPGLRTWVESRHRPSA